MVVSSQFDTKYFILPALGKPVAILLLCEIFSSCPLREVVATPLTDWGPKSIENTWCLAVLWSLLPLVVGTASVVLRVEDICNGTTSLTTNV